MVKKYETVSETMEISEAAATLDNFVNCDLVLFGGESNEWGLASGFLNVTRSLRNFADASFVLAPFSELSRLSRRVICNLDGFLLWLLLPHFSALPGCFRHFQERQQKEKRFTVLVDEICRKPRHHGVRWTDMRSSLLRQRSLDLSTHKQCSVLPS